MTKSNRWFLVCAFLLCFALNIFAESAQTIWQIGQSDNSTDEFALGDGKWNQFSSSFPHDCFFIVGQSTQTF